MKINMANGTVTPIKTFLSTVPDREAPALETGLVGALVSIDVNVATIADMAVDAVIVLPVALTVFVIVVVAFGGSEFILTKVSFRLKPRPLLQQSVVLLLPQHQLSSLHFVICIK